MQNDELVVFWFRRDLRLDDNRALRQANAFGLPVLPLFIFDPETTHRFDSDDARIGFIYKQLKKIQLQLRSHGSSLLIQFDSPLKVLAQLSEHYTVKALFANKDYEPKGLERDKQVQDFCKASGIRFYPFNDHLIVEPGTLLKTDGKPYTVFTPFKKMWISRFSKHLIEEENVSSTHFYRSSFPFPSLNSLGFRESPLHVPNYSFQNAERYEKAKDFPWKNAGTHLGPHLRYGTVSIRRVFRELNFIRHQALISELIWREFFAHILYFFPDSVNRAFKRNYDSIEWRNNEEEFSKWTDGQTGYPLVDAGMRELLVSGSMHNRVRMVAASFLCKHLLIDWRWGEAWFARHLLDYELASNNGNWQWAAGSGCDAAPWFRIFNPELQQKKFDPEFAYVKKWIPEFGTSKYPNPIVDHRYARIRAIDAYKSAFDQ